MNVNLKDLINFEILRLSIILSLAIAYGGGLWIHWQHDLAGGHEAVSIHPILHWLRDSSLALPLIILAVWLGRKTSSLITQRKGWDKTGLPNILLEIALMTLFASTFVTVGIPVHGYMFGASLEHEMSLAEHMLHDGMQVLMVNLLIIGLFNLLWSGVENRSDNRYQKIKYALSGILLTSVIIAALFLSPLSAVFGLSGLPIPSSQPAAAATCVRNITADVVALDQPFYYNRLGAIQANGMMYALKRDVVVKNDVLDTGGVVVIQQFTPLSNLTDAQVAGLAGNVMLRADKLRLEEVPVTFRYLDRPKRPVWQHGLFVLNGMLRLIGQMRPLLFFGLPGSVVLLIGLALGVAVVDIYNRTLQLAVGYAVLSGVLTIIGTIGLETGIILHSVRGQLIEIMRVRFKDSKAMGAIDNLGEAME